LGLFLSAQQPADMVGTWTGEATLEGEAETDTVTLILELKDGKLAGHMTDRFQAINGDIADVVLEQGVFNFTVPALFGEGYQGTVSFKMKVDGDSMKGELEIPEMGAKGTWQATRQK
jgi:hypothetical protein